MADARAQDRSPGSSGDLRDWLFGLPAARRSEEDDATGPMPVSALGEVPGGAPGAPPAAPPDDARLLPLDAEPEAGDHGSQGGDPTAGGVVDAVFGDARVWARRGAGPRRSGRRVTTRGALALLGVTGLLVASPAAGYWLASTTTSGTVGASTLAAPSSLSAAATPTSLAVAVLPPNGGPTPTGYTITLSGGTARACTMTQTSSPAATCTLTGLASGTSYTFAVRPTLGAWTGPSTSLTTSTATAPAPAAPALSAASDSGASSSDGVTNVARPTFTGAATSGLGGATITLYAGSTAVGSATAAADGSWSVVPTSALADGTYSVTAKASLNGGQPGTASGGYPLRIDTVAPAAPTATGVSCGAVGGAAVPLGGVHYCGVSAWNPSTGVQWTFGATDPAPSGGVATYRYFTSSGQTDPADPTTPTGSTGTVVTAGNATASGLLTTAAVYKANVVAVDVAGNVSTPAVLKAVVDVDAPGAPTVAWSTTGTSLCVTALSGQTTVYCRGTDPVITASATDSAATPVSGLDRISWTTDGSAPVAGTSSSVTSGGQLPSGTFSAEGSKTLRLLASDKAGNTSSLSTTVVTDASGPTVSSVTLANGGTAGTADSGDTITITYADNVTGLSPKTFCSDWTGTGSTFSSTGTLSVNNAGTGGAADTVTFAGAGSCSSALNLGTVQLNADYVSSATSYAATFAWSGASGARSATLTITFQSRSGGANGLRKNVGTATVGVSPATGATDVIGNAMSATTVTGGSSGF